MARLRWWTREHRSLSVVRGPAAVGLLAVLLAVVAAGSGSDIRHSAGRSPSVLAFRAVVDTAVGLAALGVIFAAAAVVTGLRTRRQWERGHERVYRAPQVPWTLRLALILLSLALLFGTGEGVRRARLARERTAPVVPSPAERPAEPPLPPTTTGPAPPVDAPVVGAIVVLGLAGAVLLMMSRGRRPTRAAEDVAPDAPGGRDGDAISVDDLADIRDPRLLVIAAYARMERALAGVGLPRGPSQTPFEYVAAVERMRKRRIPSTVRLTELFEQAKFGRREIEPAERAEAITALRQLLEDVRSPV